MPQHGGDARLVQPMHTVAGGSALNTATHLSSLLRYFWINDSSDGKPPPRTSNINLQTVINENDDHGKMLASHCSRHGFRLINRRVSNHPSCYCGTDGAVMQSQKDDKSTGHCAVIVSRGDRSFMTHLGCMEDFRGTHILTNFHDLDNRSEASTANQQTHHVHIAGYYNIKGFWDGELAGKLAEMREVQSRTNERMSISLVPQHDATDKWDGGLLNILQYIDFLIMSDVEAENITTYQGGDDDCNHSGLLQHIAQFSASKFPNTCIIVTLGPKGAVAFYKGEAIHSQTTTENNNPIDPTGAGDAFAAGFIHGYLSYCAETKDGIDSIVTPEAVRAGMQYACAAGTSCIMVQGASAPSKKEAIERILGNNESNEIHEAKRSRLEK